MCACRIGLKIIAYAWMEVRLEILKYGERHIIIKKSWFLQREIMFVVMIFKERSAKMLLSSKHSIFKQAESRHNRNHVNMRMKHWRFTVYEDTMPVSMNITTICSSSNIH